MLEFENQMLLDILNEDGLLVAARGLGLDQVFHALVKVYSDEGNLVFVIGTSSTEEEHCLTQMTLDGVSPLPRVITSEVQVSEREGFYMEGGVIFVSARIIVVDLLKGRVPLEHVTGFLVCRAHRILESCQEAFALRLFRQGNKTGFVKSFSNCPEAFTVGFARVERVMRALFARNLLLWPRFHATVTSSLTQKKPLLVELHLELSSLMQQVQCALLDLMNFTVKELKRINPMLDTDELTVENALSHSFARHLRTQVDPIWHQLSLKSRQLLSDLKTLSFLLRALTQYDCVTFETLVNPLRSMEYAMRSSGWPLLDAAETLFVSSMSRVYKLNVKDSKDDGKKKAKLDVDNEENKGRKWIPVLEVSPKWNALSEVLKEIRTTSIGNDEPPLLKVLIRVADVRTSNLLREYLTVGHEILLSRLYQKACNENKLGGNKSSIGAIGIGEEKDSTAVLKERVSELDVEEAKAEEDEESKKTGTEGAVNDSDGRDVTFTLTLSQQIKLVDSELKGESSDIKTESVFERDVEVVILPTKGKDPNILIRTLNNIHPHYIVIYDADISAVRQIEVYQSYNPDCPPRVYFLMYRGSVEEQAYLTALRKEKESFEHLIQQKASMVVPEEREGRFDDQGHPELDRDLGKSAAETIGAAEVGAAAGRKGGGRIETPSSSTKGRSKVIVDMREFSSELPSIIHRRGMDVEPITLQVGDYILTKDICVERKSVSDLIGSLQSGRLYNQATSMTRHYARPILLIEFDKDKPFVLQGKYYVSIDGRNTDVASRLQLLTLHFPRLRLVWSPSPYATAELFEELKLGREEPSAEEAATVGVDDTSKLTSSSAPVKFNPEIQDFVGKLPGVSTKNVHYLLNKGKSLDHMLTLTQSELSDILGNTKNGEALWRGLHNPLQQDKSATAVSRKGKKSFRGRGKAK